MWRDRGPDLVPQLMVTLFIGAGSAPQDELRGSTCIRLQQKGEPSRQVRAVSELGHALFSPPASPVLSFQAPLRHESTGAAAGPAARFLTSLQMEMLGLLGHLRSFSAFPSPAQPFADKPCGDC